MSFDNQSIAALFPALGQEVHGKRLRYLDNAASSQILSRSIEAVVEHEISSRANVQRASHYLAQQATIAYENARAMTARFINAKHVEEVVFTSGTTMSINLLAHCLAKGLRKGDEIVVTEAEHHSNLLPWLQLKRELDISVRVIPVTAEGRLNLENLHDLINERCRIVAVTQASNVTGAVTPLAPIVKRAHEVGAYVVVDGAQSTPHGPVDVCKDDIDFFAFSGHKCFAPNGIGVLWGKQELLKQLPPFLVGGGMVDQVNFETVNYAPTNRRFEAGTPAIAQAVGLGVALEWMMTLSWPEINIYENDLLSRLIQGLKNIDGLTFIGPTTQVQRLPVLSFEIEGLHSHDLCHILNEDGIALRGGHHCAQPLLKSLGFNTATRASIALYNDDEDIDVLLESINKAIHILR